MTLFQKKKPLRESYEFSDDDRNAALAVRKLKQDMKLEQLRLEHENMRLQIELKNAEIRARMADYLPSGDDGDTMAEQLFMPIIEKALGGSLNSSSPPTHTEDKTPSREPLTDEQMRELRDSLPRSARAWARRASDATLKTMLLQQIPGLSAQELERALVIARE